MLFAFAWAPLLLAAPGDVEGARPRVAVIDSGIARTPELEKLVIAEYDLAASPARERFRPRYDHGTMVATILARASALPPEIISLRIDDPAGCPAKSVPPCQPSARPIAGAIRWATRLGVDAINISLAMRDDPEITEAVREATARGIAVVMAAGNEGRDRPRNLAMARAGFPRAILVGALDSAGERWSGSNRPDPDAHDYSYVWRRGVEVPTARADGAATIVTGTSFATPLETARLIAPRPATMASR